MLAIRSFFARQTMVTKLLSSIFIMACSMGFTYQVNALATIYFKYDTSTELTIDTPSKLIVPDLTICIRYVDIFDFTKYNDGHNTSYEVNLVDNEVIDQLETLFRLDEIFNYTPAVDDMFSSCVVRRPGNYRLIRLINN